MKKQNFFKTNLRLLMIAFFAILFITTSCSDDDMVPTNTAPTISDQTFSIVEDANIGTSVGTVAASDADNDPLTLSIIAGNSEGVFSIESTSGEILLSETLDFETTSSYSLTVQAADNESNATAIITINVTDDMMPINTAPTISDQTFSILEDANIGTSVGTVVASDADNDPLTFSIIAGNSEGVFSIESTSGEILLSETLDFETTNSYSLTVQAADNDSNATAIITINVTDAIDPTVTFPMGLFAPILDGTLIGADYWSDQPEILSAGMGFCDIVGVTGDELTQELVEQAGGTWLSDIGCNPDDLGLFTTTSLQSQVGVIYILQTPYGELKDGAIGLDGLPIVFSWPVVTSTISLTDFQFTLNTGEIVTPLAASSAPNLENNERNCVVVFAEFGNKLPSNHPDSRFPVKCEIVADETPLMLVGPNNQMVSAVGLTWETTTSPYDDNNGPRLVGAKLNYVGNQSVGEGISNPIFNNNWTAFPNDEFALYGGGDFRLRMLTTGGFSPDGVRGLLPTDYEKFFRIHATGTDGSTVLLEEVGVDYQVMGGTLRVVGLSDLGRVEGNGIEYGDCYTEDRDNYIDIILVGDDEAARNITFLEIPSLAGGYSAFYNPGGPGTTPFSGETYSEPGPPDLEPVIIALDNPMRVSN